MFFSLLPSLRRILVTGALIIVSLVGFTFVSHAQGVPSVDKPASPALPSVPKAPPALPTPSTPSATPTDGTPPAVSQPPMPSPEAFSAQKMRLGDGARQWHPTRQTLGISKSSDGTVTVDEAKLTTYLKQIAPYVRRVPRNARPVVRAQYAKGTMYISDTSVGVPIKIVPSREGATLDIPGSVKAVQDAVAAKPTVTHIVLALKRTPARVTEATFQGINARIGHFVTRFNPGDAGRTQTVRLAIKLINGHLVPPGHMFSVNQVVGERTAARGFGMGHVFISGKMEIQQGGGMCQVASTLFNAALLANLKIVERQQHVRTVPYVKPGADATVYWGQKDFKFQNNTQTPIYISYVTTGSHAICDLYGKEQPGVQVVVSDQYQRLGARHYKAVLRRYVTTNGKKVNDYTAYSSYKWTPALDFNR